MRLNEEQDTRLAEAAADLEAGRVFAIIPGYRYAAIFYFELRVIPKALPKGGNCNALLFRRDDGQGGWRLNYRFRQYRDAKAFGSDDRKQFNQCKLPAEITEEIEAIDFANGMLGGLAEVAGNGSEMETIVIGGDAKAFDEVIHRVRPKWMHFGVDLGKEAGDAN